MNEMMDASWLATLSDEELVAEAERRGWSVERAPLDLLVGDPFDAWWEMYPRKVAKKAARRAWERLTVAQQEAARLALPAHVELWRVEGRGSVVIPHPATWLNGERWDDELEYRPDASPQQQRVVASRARMQAAVERGARRQIGGGR